MKLGDSALRLLPLLGRGYLRLTAATTRYRMQGREAFEELRGSGQRVLWAFWHNRLLGPIHPHRNEGAGVVISQSRDGELISRVVAGFGYVPLRGSSSRGGSQALREVLRHMASGRDIAVTPDGPRGPRYTVAPGLAFLARRAGWPVVPLGVGMSRKLVFSSWDRFQLPLPFGTIQLVYGEPLRFDRDAPAEEVEETIRRELMARTREADDLLGVTSP